MEVIPIHFQFFIAEHQQKTLQHGGFHLIFTISSYPVWQHTSVSPSAFSRRAVVSYWRKYVHKVLVNRVGGLNLPRKSVVRLTDRPIMTLDVYRGRKTTIQHTTTQFLLKNISCDILLLIYDEMIYILFIPECHSISFDEKKTKTTKHLPFSLDRNLPRNI